MKKPGIKSRRWFFPLMSFILLVEILWIVYNHSTFMDSMNTSEAKYEQMTPTLLQTTSLDDKNSQNTFDWNDNTKPYLIFHIGPSKTGTTTIQIISKSSDFTDALALDGYAYKGLYSREKDDRHIAKNVFKNDDCLNETVSYLQTHTNLDTKALDVPCWASRMTRFIQPQPINFFMSDEEDFTKYPRTSEDYNSLKVAFKDWNLLFVVTYRRYAEWLLSALKEKFTGRCIAKRVTWESERCENIWASLEQFAYMKDKEGRDKFQGFNYFNIDKITSGMKAANVPFKIMNFHDERQLMSSLYCDIILNTPQTCLHTMNLPHKTSSYNSRDALSMTCANIVYDAEKAGLINSQNQTRKDTNRECEYFLEANNVTHADLPLRCPTQSMLEYLLKKSLAFEQMMVPEFFASDLGKAEHNQSFWKMANERREFCDVSTEKLLEGESSWNGVLKRATFKNWTISFYELT